MAARKNPGGGKGQDKIWSDAIRVAAFRKLKQDGHPTAVQKAADELVDKAIAGDITAMKEMGDRLDGKAVQPTDNKHGFDGPVEIVLLQRRGNS